MLPRRGILHLAWHGEETLVRYAHAHWGLSPWPGRWEVSPPWARPGKAVWARTVYYDFLGRAEDVKAAYIGLGLPTDVFAGTDREGRRIELLPCRKIGQGLEYGSPEYAAFLPNGSWYSIWAAVIAKWSWYSIWAVVIAKSLARRARL